MGNERHTLLVSDECGRNVKKAVPGERSWRWCHWIKYRGSSVSEAGEVVTEQARDGERLQRRGRRASHLASPLELAA